MDGVELFYLERDPKGDNREIISPSVIYELDPWTPNEKHTYSWVSTQFYKPESLGVSETFESVA